MIKQRKVHKLILNLYCHITHCSNSCTGPESKKNKGKDSKAGKKGAEPPPESPKPEQTETINPLLDVHVEKEQDKLFIPGNTALVYLALACKIKI